MSFLGNIGGALGHSLPASIGGQSVKSSPEELRIGSHYVVVKEKLAEGGFGVIELVEESHSQRLMALKRCNVDRKEVFAIVNKEISILQRFNSPYIVTLIASDVVVKNRNSQEALLLLDYCPGGHLLDRLNSRNGAHLPSESIYRIFGQLLLALRLFHENRPPIIHRDLKLENILFGQVRLYE